MDQKQKHSEMLQIKKSLSGPILFNWFVLAKGMFLVAKNAKRLKQYPSSIFSIFVTPVSLHLGSFESQSFVTLGHRCGSTGKGGERYKTSAPQHGIRLASLLPQEAPLIRWPPSPYLLLLTFKSSAGVQSPLLERMPGHIKKSTGPDPGDIPR